MVVDISVLITEGIMIRQGSRLTFCTGCTGAPNFFS